MAQKKKKHNRPQKRPSEKYNLTRKMPDGTFEIDWTIFNADLDTNKYMSADTSDLIFISRLYDTAKKLYLKSYSGQSSIAEYEEKTKTLKTKLEDRFKVWLDCCLDANPALNIYSKQTPVDTMDFTEYVKVHDIIREAAAYMNENPDVSTLWSTSEVFDIFINPSLFYRVQRILYDNLNNAVRYCIYEYVRLRISDTEILTVPSMQLVISAVPTTIKDMSSMTIGFYEKPRSLDTYLKDSVQSVFLQKISEITGGSDFNTVHIGVMGVNCMLNTESHLEFHHSEYSKQAYRSLRDRVREIVADIYHVDNDKFQYKCNDFAGYKHQHLTSAPTLAIAAIIIANKYLKANKLSKPKTMFSVTYEADPHPTDKPIHKTRILGDSIKIVSEKRPSYQTYERIVRYHTPEWTRKGYLRKLKSGKTIEIKPSVCKRRCVNMENITSALSQHTTDYIIKPNGDDSNGKT